MVSENMTGIWRWQRNMVWRQTNSRTQEEGHFPGLGSTRRRAKGRREGTSAVGSLCGLRLLTAIFCNWHPLSLPFASRSCEQWFSDTGFFTAGTVTFQFNIRTAFIHIIQQIPIECLQCARQQNRQKSLPLWILNSSRDRKTPHN